jgi:hypothetical protein
MSTIEQNNKTFTYLLVVQEVSQRLLSELIGIDEVTREVKQTFGIYLKHGEKFRKKWIKAIRDKYGEEAEEMHETDADYHYQLFKAASGIKTDDQFIRAIALVNNIVNEKK